MTVLIDTNILLDVIQSRRPHDDAAARIWKMVEEGIVTGVVSAISFNNIFYIVRKQLGHAGALDAVRLVRNTFRFVAFTESLLDAALVSTINDLEDAIQAATARDIQADHVITRNTADFRLLGVSAVTAEDLLAILNVSS